MAVLAAAFAIPACGSDDQALSGVESSKKLSELNAEEKRTLCVWFFDQSGGVAGDKMCTGTSTGASTSVSVETVEECVAGDNSMISCTVGQLEACGVSLGGDPCNLLGSFSCLSYISCALSSE